MTSPESNLSRLWSSSEPTLNPGLWAFVSVPPETSLDGVDVLATFREKEGLTLVVQESVALSRNWKVGFR